MKRLADWWFAPAPAERLAALRIAIGTCALLTVILEWTSILELTKVDPLQWKPVGIARLFGPLPQGAVIAIAAATTLLLVAFVIGLLYRYTAPLAALGLLWMMSYRSSWGMVFHVENLMVLHVIALACAPAADVWSVGPRRAGGSYGWAIRLLVALTAATYLLAGIAKLRIGGLGWLDGDVLRNQIAFDNLRKAVYGDTVGPLARLFLTHDSGLSILSVMTLVLELGAPVALLGGRLARGWALASWAFHIGVILLMFIVFPYPVFGIAYLPLFRVERPFQWVIGKIRPTA